MHNPGNMAKLLCVSKKLLPVLSMFPHSGTFGATPNPKKLKPLVVSTTTPIFNENLTIIGARVLGKM